MNAPLSSRKKTYFNNSVILASTTLASTNTFFYLKMEEPSSIWSGPNLPNVIDLTARGLIHVILLQWNNQNKKTFQPKENSLTNKLTTCSKCLVNDCWLTAYTVPPKLFDYPFLVYFLVLKAHFLSSFVSSYQYTSTCLNSSKQNLTRNATGNLYSSGPARELLLTRIMRVKVH